MEKTDYDYIIIGSGIAGLNTALLAQDHGSVLILTKGRIEDCNTLYAQGGIAAALGPGDSAVLHMQDTMTAGAGLCDPEAVSVLTREGPQRVANLIKWGVPFDTIHGQIALGREGAHSMPRILHAGGDATGQHIETTLAQRVAQSEITVLEFSLATQILVEEGRAYGVDVLDTASGQRLEFRGRSIILATGGAGQLYRYTTNPQVATGDGVALAFNAGAAVMDLEFYQFHPTAFSMEGAPSFLLSEAMRGEGAVLRDVQGRAFMADYHPLADLAPRDVVSRAIANEMEKAGGGPVWLDISHLPADTVQARFPTIYSFCMEHGLDITKEPAPVAPAAHYMMGGIKADVWGRTSLDGLYACGEAACSAVHGANRLASNSLLDTLVFAQRVVSSTLGDAPNAGVDPAMPGAEPQGPAYAAATLTQRQLVCASAPTLSRESLQDLMWRNVGITRNGQRLLLSARILQLWQRTMPKPEDLPSYELANMVLLARLMVEAALLRQESRGSHFREDFPQPSEQWEKHLVFTQDIAR
ncbi:MAG: L-aspartate oxidase [Chloroflexi bacterium]|nr:L-aspartate oxidase [Chloroflexota bacterium]